jgi:hypothetical protein
MQGHVNVLFQGCPLPPCPFEGRGFGGGESDVDMALVHMYHACPCASTLLYLTIHVRYIPVGILSYPCPECVRSVKPEKRRCKISYDPL